MRDRRRDATLFPPLFGLPGWLLDVLALVILAGLAALWVGTLFWFAGGVAP